MANQIDTDAKVIGGADIGFGHPAICRLSDTVMLAAHINDLDELEIHKSIDNGLNWVLKKTLINATGCFNFAIMDSTKIGLVFQYNANRFDAYTSIDAGETWTLKKSTTVPIGASNKAILVYDNNISRLHFIYGNTNNDVAGMYSSNYGVAWSSWVSTFVASLNVVDADINLINNNIYWINGVLSANNGKLIWTNSGGTGISSFIYGAPGHTYHDLHIAIDSAGNRYFSYIKRNTSTTWEALIVRKNEGIESVLWSPSQDNIIVKGSSSISIDDDDNVYVFYTKTSDEKTYYRKYDAGLASWGIETLLVNVANNRINTEKHVLSGSNKLNFVYYKQP